MRLTDQEILELLKSEPNRAIEVIFKTYYRDLCMIANRYIRDVNHAEDLAQELIYDIWNKRNDLKINSALGPYLKKSVVNRSLNHIRSRRINFEEEDKIMHHHNKQSSVQENMEGKELEVYINKSIDQLPEKCRMVFVLSRFEQLSYKEIAAKLNISTKTVENQISKALKHLRTAIYDRNNIFENN